MKCKIDGCTSEIRYVQQMVCQKHYFRFMRNGSYGLMEKKLKEFVQNPAGYKKIREPSHVLANSDGYVYEHRKVIFDIYGNDLPDCEICGRQTSWETCHIDHRDEVVTNNSPSNLRPLCIGCNTGRTERRTTKKFQFGGKNLSITQWAKEPGVSVCRAQIKRRIDSGMSVEQALYMKNVTHPKRNIESGGMP